MLHHKYAYFGPTVEYDEDEDGDAFLPDLPQNIINSGNISKVPWICGVNSEEGILHAARKKVNCLNLSSICHSQLTFKRTDSL